MDRLAVDCHVVVSQFGDPAGLEVVISFHLRVHPADPAVKLALDELRFFSDELRIMGVYPAHGFRYKAKKR